MLERISAILKHNPVHANLSIHLIDPSVPGQGIHQWTQPQHLLINTIAGQVTVFCDKSVTGAGPIEPGPTFLEWARNRGYKKVDSQFVIADFGEEIDDNTYLPRSLLGEYLTWAYDQIVESLPAYVTILNHRREAVDIVRHADRKLDVHIQGGFKVEADFVFLTTGHDGCGPDDLDLLWQSWVDEGQAHNSQLAYCRSPYPIELLNSIGPEAKVAICGTGLTAADIVSALTIGLGGAFEPASAQRYRYVPCGREPKITLFSRQGLPAGGRAINQKGVFGQYKAKFFTVDLVDECRRRVGSQQLDWDRDLLPTLKKEMAYVYHCIEAGDWEDPAGYQVSPEDAAAIEDMIAPMAGRSFSDRGHYDRFIREHLGEDIAACFEGNETNPVKGAADMLRDIRDNIRYAVDYGGLTPQSHARFLSFWCSVSNRVASGPPKERNMELLALVEAGIVSIFGPRPLISFDGETCQFVLTSTHLPAAATERFDVLLRAKVELFKPETSSSPLIQNLIRSGTAVSFRNDGFHPGGLDVDRATNVITRDGASIGNLWALGYIVEGVHFYTYVLPRPFANSRSLQDSGKAVLSMVDQIGEQLSEIPSLAQEVA